MAPVTGPAQRGDEMADPAALGHDDVHAWHGRLDPPADAGARPRAADLEILSAQERARCQGFVRALDSARFAPMHAAVRRVLAGYLDVGPAAIQFGRSRCCACGRAEHGPPRIDWPATDLCWNLSRSAEPWLLGGQRQPRVAPNTAAAPTPKRGERAPAALTEAEQEYLSSQQQAGRLGLFYRCWT